MEWENSQASLLSVGGILQQARQKKGLSRQQIAEKMGVTRNTVFNWETDRNCPDLRIVPKLCDLLGITVPDLFPDSSPEILTPDEHQLLQNYRRLSQTSRHLACRILSAMHEEEALQKQRSLREDHRLLAFYSGGMAAGSGNEFSDLRPEPLFVRRSSMNSRADAVAKVVGQSMEPVYHDGDAVYFRYAESASPGDDVVCSTVRGAIIKRMSPDGGLFSLNPNYPYTMTSEGDQVRVIGVVTGIVQEADRVSLSEETLLTEFFRDELSAYS